MTTKEINKIVESWKYCEDSFLSRMFNRFIIDCQYYFGNGNKCSKHLWAEDELCMSELMKELASILRSRGIPFNEEQLEEYCDKLIPNNFYNLFEYFKYTKNGFICKASESALSCFETQNFAVSLIWESDLDFTLAGEDGCISNFDMYTPIYSYKTNLIYFILYSIAEDWKRGEIIEISNGREPTKEELKYIEDFNN